MENFVIRLVSTPIQYASTIQKVKTLLVRSNEGFLHIQDACQTISLLVAAMTVFP